MSTRELAEMTYEEVDGLDRSTAVALLPVGATEAHGPHLPLATDVIIAQAMARAAVAPLAALGRTGVILPPIAYSAAPFAAAFAGTLSISSSTLAALVVDIARELTRHGFLALAIANSHLDPTHLRSLADAVTRARDEKLLAVAFADLTKRDTAEKLTDEFRTGACHAGRFEGSIVLAERPDLVREAIRMDLAPNPSSLSTAIRGGLTTFEAAGGPRAYFGWPADATAEEGRETIAMLGAIVAASVETALSRRIGS
jgi:creatinine amidohydrolase